ncbi:nicotinate (nicotinamide) nucleotide adenylyltransferase [Pelagibacteraceae bacterium]|nr:nicotinate (nicotinamide) nucleotide adenylyltransferase [Pelagibacteraceae bacterium]
MVKDNLKNIGILGGSFDPPHKGHLYLSKQSIKILKLKKVIWAITKKNPLKKNPFFSLNMRKKLCRKIIKGQKRIQLKHYEDKLKSKTSIALIKFLKKSQKYNIFFIIGSDNLINFHKWKNYKELLKMSNLVVFSRKGFDTKAKKSVIIRHLKSKNIKFIKKLKMDISSTQLRSKLVNGS